MLNSSKSHNKYTPSPKNLPGVCGTKAARGRSYGDFHWWHSDTVTGCTGKGHPLLPHQRDEDGHGKTSWEKEECEESKAEGEEREARLCSETLTRGLISVGLQGYVIPVLTPLSPGDLFHLVDF